MDKQLASVRPKTLAIAAAVLSTVVGTGTTQIDTGSAPSTRAVAQGTWRRAARCG